MNRAHLLVSAGAGVAACALPRFAAAAEAPLRPMPSATTKPAMVAFVVGPSATVIDFAGPWETFQDVGVPSADGNGYYAGFELAMVSDDTKPLQATSGMIITPRYSYASFPGRPDVIVMGAQGAHSAEKIAWIREAATTATIVMSVCTGAFLLARTGLLDGLSATTHHDSYNRFQKQFPKVHLQRGPRYVDNGKYLTAGGLTSGIEAALHVVERFYGSKLTAQTSYYMEYTRSRQRPGLSAN